MPADPTLAETLVQIRCQVPAEYKVRPDAGPVDLWQGEVASIRSGRTGAEVCKFVLGNETEAQLVMLQRQPGHSMSGLVHIANVYQYHPNSADRKHRYKFDGGQPITPDVANSILAGLAARREKRLRVLATLGLGT